MEITEVRIKLMDEPGERLKAFCSITFDDCFVVRDLKIIEGSSGPFVAMPSRKLTARCPKCRTKNHLRARYCNQCGSQLKEPHIAKDDDGRPKLYADVAHPINPECREAIQERVIAAYEEEMIRAREPGYVSRYEDYDFDDSSSSKQVQSEAHVEPPQPPPAPHQRPAESPQPEHRDDFGRGINR